MNSISILDTAKLLLDSYLVSVSEDPNRVSERTEDLAYAIIYLVNRYADEFREDTWVEVFRNLIDQIGEIKTSYRDMVVFQAPLWCCLNRIDTLWFWLDKVLDYGLSRMSMGRTIFLNYAYLVSSEIHYSGLLKYVKWYCTEGKICVDSVLYIFMNSKGNQDEKLAVLNELYNNADVRRFPQVPEYIEPYINKEVVLNEFAYVDQIATNTILDFILFKDLTMTKQLEIDFSEGTE